jgi:uncharacterized sulfatase
MKHFTLLVLLSVFLIRASSFSAQPNLILILADDLGYADLGCYGNTFNETPNIDRLAREGMRFTQFYAGPVCSPTRCNLQSGQDQARIGITQHIPGHKRPFAKLSDPVVPLQLPLEVETFAESLGKAGYRTGYFGKWHLGGAGFGPENQGWQMAEEIKGNTQPPAEKGGPPQRTTEVLATKAVEFIQANKDHPFLLQISHAAVHIPLSTTPELKAKYDKKAPMPGYPSNPEYAGLTEELDQSVGRVVAAVEKAGIADNTLILFLSDNGGLEHEQSGRVVTSNQPLRGEKGTLYEGGIRIPAIARWTGKVPAGSRCDAPLITMDVFPSFVELAGATMPKSQPCDGISLAAVIRDPAAQLARDTLHWHLPHYHHSTPASAMRQGDWKLIEFFEDSTLELYDLKNDSSEQKNLAKVESDRVKTMHTAMQAWRKHVNARMPVPNPQYDPARADELGKGDKTARKKRESE